MIDVFPLVHALFDARDAKGFETYGRRCQTWDGRDTLDDIIEELADTLVYLVKLKAERDEAADTRRHAPWNKDKHRAVPHYPPLTLIPVCGQCGERVRQVADGVWFHE